MTDVRRSDWTIDEVQALFELPLMALVRRAGRVYEQFHDTDVVHVNQLLSIKTGACPEDCGYCSQSAHHDTGVKPQPLMAVDEVVRTAKRAQAQGVTRFCMGAAWRDVKDNAQFERVLDMVRQVNDLGLEVCATLGMLTADQARRLDEAGLYVYNHNLDTSPEYYESVITTRTYQDRLDTIDNLRTTNITVCCGGIIGMGESVADRISFLHRLATLDPHPESVPINVLSRVPGTPLEGADDVEIHETVRMIATGAGAHAHLGGPHCRGPAPDELLRSGAVLPRRGQLDLHERAQHDAHRDDAVRRPRDRPLDARDDGIASPGARADRPLTRCRSRRRPKRVSRSSPRRGRCRTAVSARREPGRHRYPRVRRTARTDWVRPRRAASGRRLPSTIPPGTGR